MPVELFHSYGDVPAEVLDHMPVDDTVCSLRITCLDGAPIGLSSEGTFNPVAVLTNADDAKTASLGYGTSIPARPTALGGLNDLGSGLLALGP